MARKKNPYKRNIRITLTYEEWITVTRALWLADRNRPADIRPAEWAMECVDREKVTEKIHQTLILYVPKEDV